ncbi:Protein kinase superfamily protein [Euphorbia peplus]|nr:Protein kinase superfamily protein [Euphorbia peplus]
MCKSKKSTLITPSLTPKSSSSPKPSSLSSSLNYPLSSSLHFSSTYFKSSSSSSSATKPSRKNIQASLPETPNIYDFAEICSATNNFLSKPYSSSSSSSSWRCRIRQKDVILFRRKLRGRDPIGFLELQQRLSSICRSHHSSLIKLLGASVSGNFVYLVYDYVPGADLGACLRNPQNPSYTVLSTWISRMQIATDIAHGLQYIHHCTALSSGNSGLVHNHIKSSSILVTEDLMNARISHFGTAELCGEIENSRVGRLARSESKGVKIEGTIGYMAPEFQSSGLVTGKCDVYAFGVVLLELVSGEEVLRYVFDEESGGIERVSLIERARDAVVGGGVRAWVDRRLKDSYPVEVAEKMVLVGLGCVEEEPERRPDMEQVAGRVSKLYLDSKDWAEKFGLPTDFSVSMAPR